LPEEEKIWKKGKGERWKWQAERMGTYFQKFFFS
jgi:hypothetical protein